MKTIQLHELYRWLRGRSDVAPLSGAAEVPLRGVAVDSRQVGDGDLFIASRGACVDSHAFIPQAVERGCAAVLVEKPMNLSVPVLVVSDTKQLVGGIAGLFLGDPAAGLTVVGITGTNGKTTTAYCLWSIMSAYSGATEGLLGTIENVLGGDCRERPLTTTPGPLALQQAFAAMVRNKARFCVMEVSSHGIEQERIAGVDFAAGILTNIGSDHLDYHGDFASYRKVKARFFERLGAGRFAVLNEDDPSFSYVAERSNARVIPYSGSGWPGLTVCRLATAGYVSFELADCDGGISVQTKAIGAYNAENICAAVCCARTLGIPWKAVAQAMEGFAPPAGRMEEVPAPGFRAFVDYAHTACALAAVLKSMSACARETDGRLILVFGCGGDRDREKRPQMGRTASEGADICFLTSDNPRSEDPKAIIDDVLTGVPDTGSVFHIEEDRRRAIEQAVRICHPGDVLLVAGKGHEDSQLVNGTRHPFDDRSVLRTVLEESAHVSG